MFRWARLSITISSRQVSKGYAQNKTVNYILNKPQTFAFHNTPSFFNNENNENKVEANVESTEKTDENNEDGQGTTPSTPTESAQPEPGADGDQTEALTASEQKKAEKKAKKEKKKKAKQTKKVIEEDEVERKKRIKKELFESKFISVDPESMDPTSENLDDQVIAERISKLREHDTRVEILKLRHKLEKEHRFYNSFLPTQRYWEEFNVERNQYHLIRFNQVFSKWNNRDLRNLSNKQYQDEKYNTLARMSASPKHYEIFPDILKKFTPTINLIAEFNHPIAQDILVYYGNVINAEFTEKKPKIQFTGNTKSFYTLMLVDAKNTTYLKEYRPSIQWLITNIPGDGNIEKGNELVEYLGATPLKEFGPNRMTFLLFKQKDGLLELENFQIIKADNLLDREPFDPQEFALQNELLPRGLAFFTCPYDFSVKPRFEKLGFGEPHFIREDHIQKKLARKQRKDSTKENSAKKWTWPVIEIDQMKE